jgi:hypothetical protein
MARETRRALQITLMFMLFFVSFKDIRFLNVFFWVVEYVHEYDDLLEVAHDGL